jgi:hypothetical protein
MAAGCFVVTVFLKVDAYKSAATTLPLATYHVEAPFKLNKDHV